MWWEDAVFYHIFPLGLCGAPQENDGCSPPENRLIKIVDWLPHIKKLGANAIYFSPVFESDRHGYDTRDFLTIDRRLGTNENFRKLCRKCHVEGFRVIIDAVFNHVGRNFWAFRDVREKKQNSRYKDWFHINFEGNSHYNDGFWYEGWEGHFHLVKLNLQNEEVVQYIFKCVRQWTEEYDIDGLRLDVAYCLDRHFLHRLWHYSLDLKPEFFLLGETLHGDYNQWVKDGMLHSCTNYECYKGLWSSLNSMNLFEIVHSLKRQFGPEYWTLYKGKHLLCFADNHDVSRAASILTNPRHLPLIYGLVFGMPGIPCIYYGSEWGVEGQNQSDMDWNLRPAFDAPEWNELTDTISAMAKAHRESAALCHGDFQDLVLTNRQTVFRRVSGDDRVLVAVNAEDRPYWARIDTGTSEATDLLTGETVRFDNGWQLPPYSVAYLKL